MVGVAPGGNGTVAGNTSTWGGAALYDRGLDRWFMWATELKGHCGMHTWTTNSQTIRASSATPYGPYEREEVQFDVWSHEVEVARAPTGQYVAYFSHMPTGKGPVCTECTDGSTSPDCKKGGDGAGIEVSPPTYMAYSLTADPRGAWSEPQRVLMEKPMMDINAAAVILPNGTVVGLWRDHNPGGKHSTPHLFWATNWSDPATYGWSSEAIFSTKAVPGAIEDMFLHVDAPPVCASTLALTAPARGRWIDANGNFHCLFHLMSAASRRPRLYRGLTHAARYDCDNCGSHAFSVDGRHWTYTGIAYTAKTSFTDATAVTFPYVERPHLVFAKDGVTPVAVTNGVKLGAQPGMQGDDQSFTLLRPLNGSARS